MATLCGIEVHDVRFPTSLDAHGSDAMHTDPDYSAAYVVVTASDGTKGYGLTFTCGNGTDIVCAAVRGYKRIALGWKLEDIFTNFNSFYRALASDTQYRWLGPEKGVVQLALAALTNAVWDMWARREGKPLWRLLSDMTPEQIVSAVDFRYIEDALTPTEALEILRGMQPRRKELEERLKKEGLPAYVTSAGWMNYTDDVIRKRCKASLAEGFTFFKMKVGKSVENDKHRARIIREEIGEKCTFAVDANQVWGVQETVDWMKQLLEFRPYWIEEPTSPDDILGHAEIARQLAPLGIKVATGEMCQNRVIGKQLLQAKAVSVLQIDAARVGGVSENLAMILMAAKFGVPVCPHAGGVGLCEMVAHLSAWDFVSVTGPNDRVVEYVDHLHEHFTDPSVIKSGHYVAPCKPGYSCEMVPASVTAYSYPNGSKWQEMFAQGLFKKPE